MSACKPSCQPGCYCMRRMARETLSPRLYADLIGKPYVADGVGPDAYDCLGLAITVLRRRGFQVPDYQSTAETFYLNHDEAAGVLGPARRIEWGQPGSIVLMRGMGGPVDRHLGVMIDHRRMLHASEQAKQVVLENLFQSFWSRRVLGYYQLEARA